MEQAKINFKQERDFGDIFSATFTFIGQEFKRLGTAILVFVLPALLIASIFMVLMGIEQQKMMHSISVSDPEMITNPFSYMGNTLLYMFILLIIYAVALTSMKCTIYGYIKLYVEKDGDGFGLNEIWGEIRKNFFPVLLTSIIVGLIVGIGTVFCIAPGIYLGVSLSLIYVTLVFEGKGFGDAFSRSFQLTGQKWWLTLGLIVIAYIMIYIIAMIFSVPGMIIGLKPLLTDLKNFDDPGEVFSTGYYISNSITYLVTYILFTIPSILLAFHYFSLVESKNKPSLLEKIDQIGTNA